MTKTLKTLKIPCADCEEFSQFEMDFNGYVPCMPDCEKYRKWFFKQLNLKVRKKP
jgi:hypothetical protein